MSHEKQKYDFIPQLDNPANVHHIELSMVPENSLVLDIGCHTGIFAEALTLRKNATVVGIDTDNTALEIALPRMQAVINMNIELSGWDNELRSRGYNNFDAIIFGDVLEHTRNPELILKATRTLLKQDGRIIVSIPNVAQWRIRLACSSEIFCMPILGYSTGHIYVFLPQSPRRKCWKSVAIGSLEKISPDSDCLIG